MSVADRYPLAFRLYPYRADQPRGGHTPVVVVGAGPIGLTVALDLGLKGHRVVVLDDHEGVGMGSRAICFSKRTLEIMHRLGAGEQMLEAGVVWQKGRVFRDRDEIYAFDLLPEDGHRFPAFINLSQIHFEKFLYERLEEAVAQGAQIEVRGKNRVDALEAPKRLDQVENSEDKKEGSDPSTNPKADDDSHNHFILIFDSYNKHFTQNCY